MRRVRRIAAVFTASAVLALAAAVPAAAYPRPGEVMWVSTTKAGDEGNGASGGVSVAGDGRYVAFNSTSGDLVPFDRNGVTDIFVWDRLTRATERVSVSTEGAEADAPSFAARISRDGRYVVFTSAATTLVPGDSNGAPDVFVHDRQTAVTERVSVGSGGAQGMGAGPDDIDVSSISDDGRFVAFASGHSNLVPNDANGVVDVFVRDRAADETELISVNVDGGSGTAGFFAGNSATPSISADGRFVAFGSLAEDLVRHSVPRDRNFNWDVFLRDRALRTTEWVSVGSDGKPADGASWGPSISGDGRSLQFTSRGSNLVPQDRNDSDDVFVYDRVTRSVERVSVRSDGSEAFTDYAFSADISYDGRYSSFSSLGALASDDTNNDYDVFVRDRLTGSTERISSAPDGSVLPSSSGGGSLSADGRYVGFSTAFGFLPADNNKSHDAFLRDRGHDVGAGALEVVRGEGEVSLSGWATFSGTTVTENVDRRGDGEPGARDAGADITGASVVYRPELEDLLFEIELEHLPEVDGELSLFSSPVVDEPYAGAPAIRYGFTFSIGSVGYEVRAIRQSLAEPPRPRQGIQTPHLPSYFGLFRCTPTCTEIERLAGGIGTTNQSVLVGVPVAALGAEPGGTLAAPAAYTALAESGTAEALRFDEVRLPDASLAVPIVEVAIAPPGTPETQALFRPAVVARGRIDARIDTSGLAPGDHEVLVRSCLASACRTTRLPIEIA